MFFLNTNRTNLTNLLGCDMVYIFVGFGRFVVKNQPQAVTLANPFRIPLHQKKQKVKKNPCQRLRCICDNP